MQKTAKRCPIGSGMTAALLVLVLLTGCQAILRDARFRNYSAENSLLRWDSVRRGETRWIFPYQENADEMFNSAICCELNIFKPFALQQLYKVTEASAAYADARRLIKMLEYFTELPEKDVLQSSILREFFGGSVFKY